MSVQEPGNILGFADAFAGATTVKLEQNYRSSKTILDAANAVIANNKDRHGKTLWSEHGAGELITHAVAPDVDPGVELAFADRPRRGDRHHQRPGQPPRHRAGHHPQRHQDQRELPPVAFARADPGAGRERQAEAEEDAQAPLALQPPRAVATARVVHRVVHRVVAPPELALGAHLVAPAPPRSHGASSTPRASV